MLARGEVAERSKAAVLKTAVGFGFRLTPFGGERDVRRNYQGPREKGSQSPT